MKAGVYAGMDLPVSAVAKLTMVLRFKSRLQELCNEMPKMEAKDMVVHFPAEPSLLPARWLGTYGEDPPAAMAWDQRRVMRHIPLRESDREVKRERAGATAVHADDSSEMATFKQMMRWMRMASQAEQAGEIPITLTRGPKRPKTLQDGRADGLPADALALMEDARSSPASNITPPATVPAPSPSQPSGSGSVPPTVPARAEQREPAVLPKALQLEDEPDDEAELHSPVAVPDVAAELAAFHKAKSLRDGMKKPAAALKGILKKTSSGDPKTSKKASSASSKRPKMMKQGDPTVYYNGGKIQRQDKGKMFRVYIQSTDRNDKKISFKVIPDTEAWERACKLLEG